MATQFAVDLVFKSQTQALDQLNRQLKGVGDGAQKAQSSLDAVTGKLKAQNAANAQLAGQLRRLKAEYDQLAQSARASAKAGGEGFSKDVISRLRGLSTEIGRTRDAFNQGKTAAAGYKAQLDKLNAAKAASGIGAIGVNASAAVGGVRALGAALQTALGPIAAVTGGIAALTGAFKTIAAQDFAEAKVRSLGTDSEALVAQLKVVSKELGGQASVAELTGAAYDVASAGFNKAADAAMVLKAASLGATGGFSDINTVGNAATSVLNAYGLAASDAALVVDRFVQTQNDGKITVGELAQNIGKVAAAAAGLNVPLEEVNAAISQATASGVQAEVAFTGLKSALARLASGEANKDLEAFGINIDASTISAEGLVGTLKKLQGLDTGVLFKVLGTEAAPALLPVIQNLERFDELIEKQKNSAGAAAAAQKEAANTIQGAWKAVSTELENLFSEQSEVGTVIKVTLFAAAEAVKQFAATVNFLLKPITTLINVIGQIARALDQAFNISSKISEVHSRIDAFKGSLGEIKDTLISDLANAFDPIVEAWGGAMDAIGEWWAGTTEYIGGLADNLGGWIQGVWNGIASGAQGIISPIGNAFQAAFDYAWSIIMNFWNSLPGWLRGALEKAGSVVGGVATAVGNALKSVAGEVNKAIAGAGKAADKLQGPKQISYKPPAAPSGAGAGAGAGGGGGSKGKKGGGGGKGAKERESQIPQLEGELALKERLHALELQIQAAQLAGDKHKENALQREIIHEQLQGRLAKIELQKIPSGEKALKIRIEELKAKEQLADLEFKIAKAEQDRKTRLDEMLTGFDREIALAGIKDEAARKLLEIEHQILDLKKQGLLVSDEEVEAYRSRAQAAAEATKSDSASQAESDAKGISSTITGGMKDAIKAAITGGDVKAALSNMLSGIGDRLLDMAFRPLEEMLTKSLTDVFNPQATATTANTLALQQLTAALQAMGSLSSGGGFGGLGSLFGGGFGVAGAGFGGGAFGAGFSPLSSVPLVPGGIFADGGSTPINTPVLVGERGPELFVPGQSGGITNHQNLRSMMASSGSQQNEGSGSVTNLSFETVQIMDQEWIDRPQLEAAMAAASKRGAAEGERRAIDKLKQSPSTRRSLGL